MRTSRTTGNRQSCAQTKRLGAIPLLKSSLICLCIPLCVLAAGCSAGKGDRPPGLPLALMEPTPAPEWKGETIGDLVDYAQDFESALARANAD